MKYIFCNRGKQAIGYMIALSKHNCQAMELQAFAPLLLGLLYKGLVEAAFCQADFPASPAKAQAWLLYLWAFLYFPSIVPHVPTYSFPSFPFWEEPGNHYREEQWSSLTVSGSIKNMLDRGRVHQRKWVSPFLELPVYRRPRGGLPEDYWPAILTPRLLVLIEKSGLSFDVYNPHFNTRQFGVAQGCASPF